MVEIEQGHCFMIYVVSCQINPRKSYQAVNQSGYEVELLAAPSTHPLPKFEPFEPMVTLIEQEWPLQGTHLSVVVATVRGRACPLYVPDPRRMALHKLWLVSNKFSLCICCEDFDCGKNIFVFMMQQANGFNSH